MKTRLLIHFAISGLSALALLGACHKAPSQKEIEDEVNRRVQEKLQQQQMAEQQQNLDQREKDLEQMEQDLANQQQQLNAQQNPPIPAPSASGAMAVSENIAGDDAENEEDYTPFYDSLQSDGDWIQTADYGYVWQPQIAVSDANWLPYSDGYWAYSDCGWTWISNEPFGWACYHYGRWARLANRGWCWVPGHEWAAAWVAWRSSGDFIGWAPLPPDVHFRGSTSIEAGLVAGIAAATFNFVPTAHFYGQDARRYYVPRQNNAAIFSRTTNITNITRNTASNVVINNGPQVSLIEQQTHQTIRPLKIERVALNGNAANRQPATISGNVLQMTAPTIQKTKTPVKPPHVKANLQRVQTENLARPQNETQPNIVHPAVPTQTADHRAQLDQQRQKIETQRQQIQQQRQIEAQKKMNEPRRDIVPSPLPSQPIPSQTQPQRNETKPQNLELQKQQQEAANHQAEQLRQQQAQQLQQQQAAQRAQMEIQRQQQFRQSQQETVRPQNEIQRPLPQPPMQLQTQSQNDRGDSRRSNNGN